jgi:pilus assembly protein CpaB
VLAGAQLNLVMRSPADNNVRIQTEAVTLQFIMEQYRIPLPAKLPYGLEPRKDEIGFPTEVPVATPRP